jgi:hypothetical protein
VTVYRCASLLVSSPLELAAPAVDGAPDVEVVDGGVRAVPLERPSAEVVAERVVNGEAWYTFARCGEVVVGRFYGLADFEIETRTSPGRDGTVQRVTFYRAPTAPIGLIAILIAGSVVAYLLSANGRLVLHASAVEVDGAALAFVGQSGQGKTTMATLLCAAGYPLVADDLLPVEPHGTQVMCVPVGTELRVREKVEVLLERFDARTARRLTVDERHALAPLATTAEQLQLTSLAVPWPDREETEVSARRLTAGEAVITLARYQRIEGWVPKAILRAQFAAVSALAAAVPVLVMRVPWGPPFGETLAGEVLSKLGLRPRAMSSLTPG